MSSITIIQETDLITNSRTNINDNFTSLDSSKIETSVLDTDITLAANSDSKIATQKAVKAYVDSGGNQNASTSQKGLVEEATSAEVVAKTATGATGARLFVNPSTLGSLVKFGGDGSDGALVVTSGTTTIDLGAAAVVIKNYTSISITGTGKVVFSNPHANGTVIVIKSQGAITLTSSGSAPIFNASGMGAAGGAGGSAGSGITGTNGIATSVYTTHGGVFAPDTTGAAAGGAAITTAYAFTSIFQGKYPQIFIGAGGGGGTHNQGTSGTGGKGGAALIIECAGAWNFTITGGISVKGASGGNGTGAVSGNSYATGGGGGGGGMCFVLYNTLTANSGTILATGGTGGTSSIFGTPSAITGGGGGGSIAAGSASTGSAVNGTQTGGDGANGSSLVVLNTEFT